MLSYNEINEKISQLDLKIRRTNWELANLTNDRKELLTERYEIINNSLFHFFAVGVVFRIERDRIIFRDGVNSIIINIGESFSIKRINKKSVLIENEQGNTIRIKKNDFRTIIKINPEIWEKFETWLNRREKLDYLSRTSKD